MTTIGERLNEFQEAKSKGQILLQLQICNHKHEPAHKNNQREQKAQRSASKNNDKKDNSLQHSTSVKDSPQNNPNTFGHNTTSTDYEHEVRDCLRVALEKIPDVKYSPLSEKDLKLSLRETQILNNFWTYHRLSDSSNDSQGPSSEFTQKEHFQLDFGFTLSSTSDVNERTVQLTVKHYKIGLKLPCVVFVEITLANSIPTLRKTIIQLLKNRLIFRYFPDHFIADGEYVCPITHNMIKRYENHNSYLMVVSNSELLTGLENFNLAYFDIIKNEQLLKIIKRMSQDVLFEPDNISEKVIEVIKLRNQEHFLLTHLSIPSSNSKTLTI